MTGRALGALRIADPSKWKRLVTKALDTNPTVQLAANELGVSWRTLMRWRAELGVECK